MKRLISILAAIILISAVPGGAAAAPPDWTLVQIPAPQSDAPPVYIDMDGYFGDIALDINDNLYVMSGSKVMRFTVEGKADTSWGNNGVIYDNELEAAYSEMLSIAADSRGYVYALCRICEDGSPKFIKRYTPDGKADPSWYGDGIMGGKFAGEEFTEDPAETAGGIRNAHEIALDSEDSLYVLYDRQVYKFLPDGAPDKKWRKVVMKQPEAVYDDGGEGVWFSNAMCIDRGDNLYLFNGYKRTVSKYSKTGRSLKKQNCPLYYSYEDHLGETIYAVNRIAFDAEGNVYNLSQNGNSISKYSSKMKPDKKWCENGTFTIKGPEPIQTISDFEMDTAGNIYILDDGNKVISRYTAGGEPDSGWGTNGSIGSVNGDGSVMLSITDIICDSDGSMYALSGCLSVGSAVISKISPDFTPDITWGADISGIYRGHMIEANNSIAAYNGNLYIERSTASVNDGVIRLSEGKEDPEWKMTSRGPVWDIHTDKDGNIYVAGERITKYLPDGNVDESWGLMGSIDGAQFIGEMATDGSGCLYISDRGKDCILRYTPGGQTDRKWGENGKAGIPGAAEGSEAYYSYFIAVDSAGNLYLSDYLNDRILRYDSKGSVDTSWCGGGEWRAESGLSGLAPMMHPTHLMIRGGKLYAIWNDKLYAMSDMIARVGIKPVLLEPYEPAENAASTAEALPAWRWAVSIGGLLFCAGAVTAIFLLAPKKKNKKRRLTKVKSIKIAKR